MLRHFGALLLSILLCSCASTPTERRSEIPTAAPLTTMPAPGVYTIDPANSELRVLVYRAGPLSNFGHNHVMVNRELSGTVKVGTTLESTSFTLSVPVTRFAVDETQARLQEGEDFPGEISESAKEGTLHNMLSPTLLNGESHPTLEIRSEQLEETNGQLNAIMAINVAGHNASIEAPFVLVPVPHGVGVSATFEVRQTELGLTPLSLMAGALQVRDALHIKLTLRALAP